eukprot:315639_1
MARAYARELAKKEKERNIKKQNDRKALEALWDIQKDERKLHEKLKSETKERARKEVFSWASKSRSQTRASTGEATKTPKPSGAFIEEITSDDDEEHIDDSSAKKTENSVKKSSETKDIFAETTPQPRRYVQQYAPLDAPEDKIADTVIELDFTEMEYRGAAREGKAPSEVFKKVLRFKDNPNRQGMEENHPAFLKDKGDRFFKHRDRLAAVRAYSESIALDSAQPECLYRRGLCSLELAVEKIGNSLEDPGKVISRTDELKQCFKLLRDCVADSKKSLEMTSSDEPERMIEIIVIQGRAYFSLGENQQSLELFERALKIMARIQSTNDARTEGENDSESKQESDSSSKKVDDSGSKRPKCIVDVGWLTKTVEEVERVCR